MLLTQQRQRSVCVRKRVCGSVRALRSRSRSRSAAVRQRSVCGSAAEPAEPESRRPRTESDLGLDDDEYSSRPFGQD